MGSQLTLIQMQYKGAAHVIILIFGNVQKIAHLRRKLFLISCLLLCIAVADAQDSPVGNWESLLPYNTALGVATNGNDIYTICDQAFFTFSPSSGDVQTYSKVNGMSDIGMSCIAYDDATSTVVLAYADGNIDLFKNNTFYNIPDFKLKTVAALKTIYSIHAENGMAYVSTSAGVIVIDLAQQAIVMNYEILSANLALQVYSFGITDSFYFAATSYGLLRVYKNDPLIQNSGEWKELDIKDSIKSIVELNNNLYFSDRKKVFILSGDTLARIYTSESTIQHIDAAYNYLLIGEGTTTDGVIKKLDANNSVTDSFDCATPTAQAVERADSSIWVACPTGGLLNRTAADTNKFYVPDGPTTTTTFDVYAYDRNLWIAHGGYNELYFADFSANGMSNYKDGKWTLYKESLYPPLTGITDISAIVGDATTGDLYAGSYMEGLFTLHPNGTHSQVSNNSIFAGSVAYGSGYHQIVDMTIDKYDNLWVSLMFAPQQLYVKTHDSLWYSYRLPTPNLGGYLAIDDSGQIWMACFGADGVIVYNTNNTLSDTTDDHSYHLQAGVGNGNLPSNNATCIAKDLNNKIWIGTDNGIAIVSDCEGPFSGAPPCDALLPVVQYGAAPGYLFAGYNVNSIAVDGGNRKWVGTDNGAWLLSADASQVINSYTTDNSPLPSNNVTKIAIDKVTGDVYLATDQGMVSYRGAATDGGAVYQNVTAFPNPVPSGYTGTIAINGLVNDAEVRITDISGQLVYKTNALGGQATWNGKDYLGHRPQSGVYLFFVSANGGKQNYTGKIVFMQ